jgi:CHASE3 domain sensor protein
MRTRAAADSEQLDRLARLAATKDDWLKTDATPLIEGRALVTKGEKTLTELVIAVRSARGKEYMDAMRGLVGDIQQAEQTLLDRRQQDMTRMQEQSRSFLLYGASRRSFSASSSAPWPPWA